MKTTKTFVKTLAIGLLAAAGLSGCVAVPYGPDPYGPQSYGSPVVVMPAVSLGLGFGHGGHRHRNHHRGRR